MEAHNRLLDAEMVLHGFSAQTRRAYHYHIQAFLGHSRLETTQIYTRVSTAQLAKVRNPLETLMEKTI